MANRVAYFAYGANRNPEMIEAVIGRLPKGEPARLRGFELCVQTWPEIPEPVRNILSPDWGPDFRAYRIRPAEDKSVRGMIWYITPNELNLIKNWEIDGLWTEPARVSADFVGRNHVERGVITSIIHDPSIKISLKGERYDPFLNEKDKMLQAARRSREIYLREREGPSILER